MTKATCPMCKTEFKTKMYPPDVPDYDSSFGDNRICECEHPYYRHFDTYDDMYPVGCKYCQYYEFEELKDAKPA